MGMVKQLWHIYVMEYYSVVKRNKLATHPSMDGSPRHEVAWKKLGRNKNWIIMIPFILNSRIGNTYLWEWKPNQHLTGAMVGVGRPTSKSRKELSEGTEMFYKLRRVLAVGVYTLAKLHWPLHINCANFTVMN